MASARKTLTTAWSTALVDGAKAVNLCAPREYDIFYWVGSSAPTGSDIGHNLRGGDTHPIALASGEHLYARIVDGFPGASLQAVVTDA